MFRIGGGTDRLCSGLTRRDALRVGGLGIAGFGLADLFRGRAAAASTSGRARNVIMVHLGGGPSHVDTYDPKPEAPSQIRGEFRAIPTSVDGIQICELFPLQAKMMDRMALIRSIHRGVDEHSSSHTTTGYSVQERRVQGDRPSLMSVVARTHGDPSALVPPYVSLRGTEYESGLGAAFLGAAYEALRSSGPGRGDLKLRVADARMAGRRRLLERIDRFREQVDAGDVTTQDVFARRALEVLSSTATYDALDLAKEDPKNRERYGKGVDNFILARRLVEAGVHCVALEYGGWDTHENNFGQLRRIMPPLDRALAALIQDLVDRGLYEQTLVVVWGEFGRTPKVNGTAGRDHWSRVMSAMIAGGGLRMGQAVGSTDAMAGDADETPVRIRNVIATLYHALGIPADAVFRDGQNRPIPLIPDAEPIPQLI
jgi:hypothetical protein